MAAEFKRELQRVDVYHNQSRDASFGLNSIFRGDGKDYESRSHELRPVFTYWTADKVTLATGLREQRATLNAAFHEFNVGHDPEFTTGKPHRVALAYRDTRSEPDGWGLRSLSVGDVIKITVAGEAFYYSCDSAGWSERYRDELNIKGD